MPDLNYHSGYADFNQGISNLGNSLQGAAVGIAQMQNQRAMQAQQMYIQQQKLAQQGQLNQAHIGYYNAEAAHLSDSGALLRATAAEKTQGVSGRTILADAAAQLPGITSMADQYPDNPPMDIEGRRNDVMSNLARGMAMLPDKERSKLPVNLAQVLSMGNPTMRGGMALGYKGVTTTPANAISTSIIPGMAPQMGPAHLGPGNILAMPSPPLPPGVQGPPTPAQIVAANTMTRPGDPGRDPGRYVNVLGQTKDAYGRPPEPGTPYYELNDIAKRVLTQYGTSLLGQPSPVGQAAAGAATGVAPQGVTPPPAIDKVALARKISSENPTWSKQQVIDEVNKRVK